MRCAAPATPFTVAELGSLNGTYVNRTPIDRLRLADGDVLLVGAFRVMLRSRVAEVVSAPAGATAAGELVRMIAAATVFRPGS